MRVHRWLSITAVTAALLALPSSPAQSAEDRCPAEPPTIVGTPGDDELDGTSGDDVIHALGGDDTVRGGGGHDVICGGPGTDRLLGENGDDALYGGANGLQQRYEDNPPDNVGDLLVPGEGDDHVDAGHDTDTDAGGGWLPDRVSFAGSSAGVTVDLAAGTVSGQGADTVVAEGRLEVIGSSHDDVLLGSGHPDELSGGEGADILRGFEGDDSLHGDPDIYRRDRPGWDDEAYGGAGDDVLVLGNGDDVGRGGVGDDSVVHGSGHADLTAGPGNDYLETYLEHADDQQVLGGSGRDTLYAWAVLSGAGDLEQVDGRIDLPAGVLRIVLDGEVRRSRLAGVEVLRIPDGRWRVVGTGADERFYGADTDWSRLVLQAAGGDDLASGTPGDDRIDGGPGSDRSGDSQGRDVCIDIERWFSGPRCEVDRAH